MAWAGVPASPAAAQRCAAGAGLDGATEPQATLHGLEGETPSDAVRQIKFRILHITYPVAPPPPTSMHQRLLILIGALPTWGHSRSWGYMPSGVVGVVVIVLIVLLLTGRL